MKLADVFSNYFTVRHELRSAVQGLTQAQLDWNPGHNHPATIGKLSAHIADCEYFWIQRVALKSVENLDSSEFENAVNTDEILTLFDREHAVFKQYLESEALSDWDDVFYTWVSKGERERFSKRWLVWHVVEHQARHRGQIFTLMRMQGLDGPDV